MKDCKLYITNLHREFEEHFAYNRKIVGRIYALIASLASYTNILVVKLSKEQNVNRLMFFRGIFLVYCSWLLLRLSDNPSVHIEKTVIYKVILRSVFLILSFNYYYYGISFMGLREALTIFNTNPALTYALAVIFLNERLSLTKIAFIAGTVCGLVLIVNPGILQFTGSHTSFTHEQIWAALYLLFAATCKSLNNILLKTIKINDLLVNLYYTGAASAVLAGISFVWSGDGFSVSFGNFFLFLVNSLTTFLIQAYLFKASRFEDASVIAVIGSLSILYSFLIETFIFRTKQEFASYLGSCLVIFFMGLLVLKRGD